MLDLIIIGAGPAGVSAAIYASRASLSYIVIDAQPFAGGQMANTDEIDNYPGTDQVNGFELGNRMESQARRLGAEFVQGTVLGIRKEENIFFVSTAEKEYEAKTVIYALGSAPRHLNVPGEAELAGRGVSYCAVCDGAFFRGKEVIVAGGGNTAVGDAVYLAKLCKKVWVVHRRDSFRASKALCDQLSNLENAEIIWNAAVTEIHGENKVEEAVVTHIGTNLSIGLPADGVFVAIGAEPQTKLLDNLIELDHGYVPAGEECVTACPGLFAAGDVRTKKLRQIVTACADGANAVNSAIEYINSENV